MNLSDPPVSTALTSKRAGAPAITLENVSKNFGRFAALRAITAEFQPRRMYTILGDNGAGKTTLLRTLAGLLHPTRGKITVLGSDNLRAITGELGYMAHPSLLYDEMSGMENLRYFAALYGIDDEERCRRAMATVGLEPGLERRIDQYSQGMRQRLSLARAVVHDPKILLLDEPFSNVDVGSGHAMVQVLGKMRDEGKTIFIVTHQASLLEGVTDEFVWMSGGTIVERTRDLPSRVASESRATAQPVRGAL